MFKSLLLALMLSLFFLGCGTKTVGVNQKSFDEEDIYIMSALLAENEEHYATAFIYYDELYNRSESKEYLFKSLEMLQNAKEYKKLLITTQAELVEDDENLKLRRIEIEAYLGLMELDTALTKSLALVEETSSEDDYMLVGSVYLQRKEYKDALNYTERAYSINYDEDILDRLVIIMFVNLERKEEAIAYLESHSRLHGCSEKICSRLVGFYSAENNIDGMLEVYLRMYHNHIGGANIAKAVAKIYAYKKDYNKLMLFLEESEIDNKLLMQVYVQEKRFNKASTTAQKIYKKNGELFYLGQSAIFMYESADEKNNTKMLDEVISQLKEVVSQEDDPTFLNYLGYLMIDHEIDVKEGIAFVNKALKHEPESGYYLDSLAWGYYKLNQCKEASRVMKDVVVLLGAEDDEVKTHVQAIDKCKEK